MSKTVNDLPPFRFKLCSAEPLIVLCVREAFISVTGKPSAHMTLTSWFTYVVLPQP